MLFSKFKPLEKGSEGTPVTNLQRILTFLGFLITDRNGFFGVSTERAVMAWQKANKEKETGQIEKKAFSQLEKSFAEKVDAEIQKGEGKNYFVFGRIVNDKSKLGVSGLKVEAWDKDLIYHNAPLGETISTEGGWFRINFISKEAKEWIYEREPALFFAVYEGKKRVTNTINSLHYKAGLPPVDLVIPVPVASGDEKPEPVSTFLELVKSKFSTANKPFTDLLLDEVVKIGSIDPVEQLADLSTNEIAEIITVFSTGSNFFSALAQDMYNKAKEVVENAAKAPTMNIEPVSSGSMEALKAANQDEYDKTITALNKSIRNQNLWQELSNTYSEPVRPGVEAFTRHLRKDQKNEGFAEFFKQNREEVISELKKTMTGLEPGYPFINRWAALIFTAVNAAAVERRKYYRFTGQVVNTISKEKKGISGFSVHTQLLFPNEKDTVELGFTFTDNKGYFRVEYSILSDEQKDNYSFLFKVYNEKGVKEILSKSVKVPVASDEVIELGVRLEPEPVRKDVKLEDVLNRGRYPERLTEWFKENELTNFTQIAAKGGLRNIKGFPVDPDSEMFKSLEGHTNLSLFSADVTFNEALINKGYTGIRQIANTPREVFVENAGKEVGEFRASSFHAGIRHSYQYLNNLLVQEANNDFPNLNDLAVFKVCECEECNSVVSPLAYVAELLNYVLDNIKDNGGRLTTFALEDFFHQPFGRFRISCSSMEERECQIRLATEILWMEYSSVLNNIPQARRNALERSVAEYTLLTYQTILQQLGTSYEEIRLIRHQRLNETTKEFESRRKSLVDRLGINLVFGTVNTLEALFRDPSLPISEAELERVFGFRDTQRDVLSSTPISRIHNWRLAHLRTLWQNNDWIEDEYTRNELPVIDPDVIGIDDFRTPVIGEPVFDTWQKRRDWIDYLITQFAGFTIVRGIYPESQVIQIPGTNLSSRFSPRDSFNIAGSSGNDGLFTIISVKYENGDSFLFVQEAIPDTTADGNVEFSITRNIFSIDQASQVIIITNDDLSGDLQVGDTIIIQNSTGNDGSYTVGSVSIAGNNTEIVFNESIPDPTVDGEIVINRSIPIGGTTIPDIETCFLIMYQVMYQGFNYDGTNIPAVWDNIFQPDQFEALYNDLGNGTKDEVETVTNTIFSALGLKTDAFKRMVDIYQKDQDHANRYGAEPVSADEWSELYNILVQVVKEKFYPTWIQEEDSSSVYLNPRDFWKSLSEPEEGEWPSLLYESPLIDPELMEREGLPGPTAGASAHQFYIDRQEQLDVDYENLKMKREAGGFDSMIEWALGTPNQGDPLPYDIIILESDLSNSDSNVVANAQLMISTVLFMPVKGFKRIMEIHAKEGTDSKPSQEEWKEIYTILTTAQKRKRRYAIWNSEEQAQNLTYWRAYKARLPKWRASFAHRATWQDALKKRSKAPIIDPDVLFQADFNRGNNSAYTLWETRRNDIEQLIDGLHSDRLAAANDLAWIESIMLSTLGITIEGLYEIRDLQNKGKDIRTRLTQLNLTLDSFERLLTFRTLAQNAETILESEWGEVYRILARVRKERFFRDWQIEEENDSITLSQDFFKLPEPQASVFPLPEPLQTPQWLTQPRDRRNWQRVLEGRIEQEETVIEGLNKMIEDTEEIVLIPLRDALIKAIDNTPKFLTDHLLIDTQNNCCGKTTRVSQAIETLQGLLWSINTGQLEDTYPNLTLEAVSFEEEWQWIGSYATWRAAMFVFIYPENILLPSLRKFQSPAFSRMVNAMRSNRRLNPEQACQYAKEYSIYFKDICNLTIQSTCVAETRITNKECRKEFTQDYLSLFYKFALSDTHKVYCSVYDPNNNTGYADGFWDTIPGLKDNVTEIIGSPAYKIRGDERYLYLFLRYKDGNDIKLGYTRFNLEKPGWEGSLQVLDNLPAQANELRIIVIQSTFDVQAPQLVIRHDRISGTYFKRGFNIAGDDWEEGDWENFKILSATQARNHNDLYAAVSLNLNSYILITSSIEGRYYIGSEIKYPVHYRIFGEYDDGKFYTLFEQGIFSSATYWFPSIESYWNYNSACYVFYEFNGNFYKRIDPILGSSAVAFTESIDNIGDFDDWMKSVFGLSFKMFTVPESFPRVIRLTNLFAFLEELERRLELVNPSCRRSLYDFLTTTESEWMAKLDPDFAFMITTFPNYVYGGISLDEALITLMSGSYIRVKKRDTNYELESGILGSNQKIAKDYGEMGTLTKTIAYYQNYPANPEVIWRDNLVRTGTSISLTGNHLQLTPDCPGFYEVPEQLTETELPIRKSEIEQVFTNNSNAPDVVLDYLREAFYFVPIHLGIQLQQRSHFISAINYYRTVYDYSRPTAERKIYYGLTEEETLPPGFSRAPNWMLDPLNPHAIASSRANIYTHFTILTIVRCFLEYGDAEFTYDTSESVPRARILYTTALELLALLLPQPGECTDSIGMLNIEISDGNWVMVRDELIARVKNISSLQTRKEVVTEILMVMSDSEKKYATKFDEIDKLIYEINSSTETATLEEVINNQNTDSAYLLLASDPLAGKAVMKIQEVAQKDYEWKKQSVTGQDVFSLVNGTDASIVMSPLREIRNDTSLEVSYPNIYTKAVSENPLQGEELAGTMRTTYVPKPFLLQFCVPRNPVINALFLKAELELFKIRNCMNIAGIKRELDAYAAPTDTISGLPTIGTGGQLILPGTVNLLPTPYRFKVLIERSKQLVNLAQQVEAAFLAALEKFDHEAYDLLKARQDLELAKAGIRLQDMRIIEAKDGVELSELQLQRSEIQVQELDEMINAGLNAFEQQMIELYYQSARISIGIALENALITTIQSSWPVGIAVGAASASRAALEMLQAFKQADIQKNSLLASFENRKQEWKYQKTLAKQDIKIGSQQVKISEDRVRVVGQEREIAEIQKKNAEEGIEFLKNKFTSAELYDWMINILEGVYSFFLQQATSTALQAANQLAFERQELPPPFIQADYWDPPASNALNALSDGGETDRRGLTGSARLLQDIYQLDQYAFDTDSRKQQLTKTISLATYEPVGFQKFRDSGVITFGTPMEIFDRDFPGHYLRLIKRVKISVIALVPPTEGIKATLSNTGLSRVVIGGDIFQNVQVRRSPETISLSSPREATGMFEMQQESEFLNPFESQGVATFWEFRMEKASNFFDYRSIADVLVTIDYTALNSYDYRRQVIQNLGNDVSLNRPFSFKNQFADQWYDLHNPDNTLTPMSVRFTISREDFPPNITDLMIEQVALYFAFNDQTMIVPIEVNLNFTENGTNASLGGGAVTDKGLTSTLQGNAGSWISMIGKTPFGQWDLSLPGLQSMGLFEEELIDDILLVITYNGYTANWL